MSQGILVPYVDLAAREKPDRDALLAAVANVLDHGWYVLGGELSEFERRFASLCGVRYAIGVNSGTDALVLAMKALGIGPGDEVITVPNSFLATASSIILAGARPVFVDVGEDGNIDPDQIPSAVTHRTRAIVPVHLSGRPADMDAVNRVADRYGLAVIEDAAQAVGARYRNRPVGSLGHVAAFSLHPLKNLAAVGDGGMVTTDDPDLAERLVQDRNHGLRNRDECDHWSWNSRLDTIQAAMLLVKLDRLAETTQARRATAAFYSEYLADVIEVPAEREWEYNVYHAYVVRSDWRDEMQRFLRREGVDTKVHYPIPIHLQDAAKALGYHKGDFPRAERQAERILSLPVGPEVASWQRQTVVEAVRRFAHHQPTLAEAAATA